MKLLRRRAPQLILGLTSLLLGHWFWPEIDLASLAYNDGINHLAVIRMMDHVWSNGGNILDFWMPHINFGHAFLRSYQFLFHLLVWVFHHSLFSWMTLERCFNTCVTLMAMALPWTFYQGARLLGLGTVESLASAIALVMVHEAKGYGIGLTNFTFSGYGTYNQLLATVFFPLAIGYAHRLVRTGQGLLAASLFFSAAFMSHIMTGYFACLWIAIDSIFALMPSPAPSEPDQKKKICLRLAKLAGLCLLWTGHWLIPMAGDCLLQHHSIMEPGFKWNGIGGEALFKEFAGGTLSDADRFPVLTILATLGVGIGIFRKKRLFSLQAAIWFLLSFGPETWGSVLRILPFSGQLHWHRFFAGSEIAFCFCSGISVGLLWQTILELGSSQKKSEASAAFLSLALLVPCIKERDQYFEVTNRHWLTDTVDSWSQSSYRGALEFALAHPDARYYAGTPWNWGQQMKLSSYIPLYGLLTQYDVEVSPTIYHHQSHSEVLAFKANPLDLAQNELTNIRYVALTPNMSPPKEFHEMVRGANFVIYDDGIRSSYFAVGRKIDGGCVDDERLAESVSYFLTSSLLAKHVYPVVNLKSNCDGEPSAAKKMAQIEKQASSLPDRPPGEIAETGKKDGKSSDLFWAKVQMTAPGTLLFKMNFHPNWRARVNGKEVPVQMVVPAFMGIDLEAGESNVELTYKSDGFKLSLQVITAVGLLLAALFSIRSRRKK